MLDTLVHLPELTKSLSRQSTFQITDFYAFVKRIITAWFE